jgi:transposase
MRRREFITLLGGAAAGWPLVARAQQPALPMIGLLSPRSPAVDASLISVIRQGLNDTGFIEGQNVALDYRWADGQYDRLTALAADLVHRKAAVIIALGGEISAVAAKTATATIPIVFLVGSDPVQSGLVARLNRPGGNITGVSSFIFELSHGRRLCRSHPQRRKARRSTHPAADQVRAGDQSQHRPGARHRRAGHLARPRRRGDRMMGWMAPLRHRRAKLVFCRITRNREPSMSEVTTIGLDLAKHVFQVHGIDAQGATVLRKRLRRGQVLGFFSRIPRCLVGLEACATAHYWARELAALGHEVRLMPAQYVKAYIKRNKHDAADAEAICEAVQRPTMRFVPVKTAEQQAAQLLHRGREQLVRQRTMLVNALRAHLAEFGMVAAQGLRNVAQLIAIVRDEDDLRLPDVARQVLQVLANQIEQIEAAITALEKQLMAWHKTNPVSQRLASIPGIGPIIATAIATTVADPGVFRSGREFGAWLGLVPRQNSTGGKTRLGGITKRGNRYLRRLLINGASANLLRSKATKADPWVIGIRRRRPPLVVAVALANKTARIAWAVMLRQEQYQPRALAA